MVWHSFRVRPIGFFPLFLPLATPLALLAPGPREVSVLNAEQLGWGWGGVPVLSMGEAGLI